MRKKRFFFTFGEGKTERRRRKFDKNSRCTFSKGVSHSPSVVFSWMHFCRRRRYIIFAVMHVTSPLCLIPQRIVYASYFKHKSSCTLFMIYLCTRDAFRRDNARRFESSSIKKEVFWCVHERKIAKATHKGKLRKGKRPKKWVTFQFRLASICFWGEKKMQVKIPKTLMVFFLPMTK